VSDVAKPGMRVVTGQLHRVRRGRGKGFSAASTAEPTRRPARVAVTLALAHSIQRAIDRGEIRDQAEAARRLGLTRARLSQIAALTLLAPELQEEILFLESVGGVEPLTERALRGVVHLKTWVEQRRAFSPCSTP
jgi:hypothetical protein